MLNPPSAELLELLPREGLVAWITDPQLRVLEVLGKAAGLQAGTDLQLFFSGPHQSMVLTALHMALQGKTTECGVPLAQGTCQMRIGPRRAAEGSGEVLGTWATVLPSVVSEAKPAHARSDRTPLTRTLALYEVTRVLASASSDLDILNQIVAQPCQVLNAWRSLLITFSDDQDAVQHYVFAGDFDDTVVHPTLQELKEGLTGWVMRERQMAYSLAEVQDHRESPLVQSHREQSGCGGIVVLPIQTEARIFGTLTIITSPGEPDLTVDEVNWLESLSNVAATALEQRRLHEQLVRMAHHDPLTGLPNRTLFADRVQQAIHRARRNGELFALLVLDLDGFKGVNDTHGHDAGDALLQEVAHRLQASLRQSDTVARLGGDEFTVVLSELVQPEDAVQVAQKLLQRIQEPVSVQGQTVQVSASIGVGIYPYDGETLQQLHHQADLAMYQAKHGERNRVVCCPKGNLRG